MGALEEAFLRNPQSVTSGVCVEEMAVTAGVDKSPVPGRFCD